MSGCSKFRAWSGERASNSSLNLPSVPTQRQSRRDGGVLTRSPRARHVSGHICLAAADSGDRESASQRVESVGNCYAKQRWPAMGPPVVANCLSSTPTVGVGCSSVRSASTPESSIRTHWSPTRSSRARPQCSSGSATIMQPSSATDPPMNDPRELVAEIEAHPDLLWLGEGWPGDRTR
jgi:hypothetical protein